MKGDFFHFFLYSFKTKILDIINHMEDDKKNLLVKIILGQIIILIKRMLKLERYIIRILYVL